jgi:predicted ArsR family transcriptional regulator
MRYSLQVRDHSSREMDAVALLSEPIRRRLYDHVAGAGEPVDRDRAAAAAGIGRSLAAFHLDRLVAGGLLDVEYHRRSGRSGPGAGRPAKFYRRATDSQVDVSVPPRRYGLAAEILADGIDRTPEPGTVERVRESARAVGKRMVAATSPRASGRDGLISLLTAGGYEPREDSGGRVELRNCPFDLLVERHRALTCSMNLALLEAVVGGVGNSGLEAAPTGDMSACCVALVPVAPHRRVAG